MAKFAKVEQDGCIACGVCGSVAPDIFDFNDEGVAFNMFGGDNNTGTVEIGEDLYAALTDATENCPTEVITVQDTPFA